MVSVFALAAVLVLAVAAAAGAKGGEPGYKARIVLSSAYGAADSDLGLRPSKGEGDPLFPLSVAVSDSGELLMADSAKHRIARFSRAGEYLGSVNLAGRLVSDVTPFAGRLAALDAANGTAVVFDGRGTVLSEQSLAPNTRRQCSWRISALGDELLVKLASGVSQSVFRARGGLSGLDHRAQQRSARRGRVAGLNMYEPVGAGGGRVIRHAASGPDQVTAVGVRDLRYIDVIGEDSEGHFYVLVESGTAEGGCRTECRKYTRVGELVAAFQMANSFLQTVRSAAVAPDGTVFQLICTPDAATVWEYSRAQGGDDR